jgi:hypothetical protein
VARTGSAAVVADAGTHPGVASRWLLRATVLLCALVLGGIAGWRLQDVINTAPRITVDRVFSGTVSMVNATGDAGCVTPMDGAAAVCSDFAVVPRTKIARGAVVEAAHVWRSGSGGSRSDVLLLYTASR